MIEIEDLRDILADNALRIDFLSIKSPYYTEKLLDELIDEEAVRRQLSMSGTVQPPDFDSIVDFCKGRGRKLFCIIVLAWRNNNFIEPVRFFMENGFEDKKLSAELDDQGDESRFCLNQNQLKPPLWRSHTAGDIIRYQWQFLIPVFSTKKTNYSFAQEVRLPFKKVDTGGRILGGTFSAVHKVMIQPGHFIDIDDKTNQEPRFFAVKEIRPPTSEEKQRINDIWANEVSVMKKMNVHEKGHRIVRCLTAFTRGTESNKDYFLILEWANGGSLEDLFEQHKRPVLSEKLIRQAVVQLHSLAEALKATHEHNIRHGDLKPGNILRFDPDEENIIGTLKIGDWGLAKFHSTATSLRGEKGLDTTTKYGTALYEAPEVELGEAKLLGRQYDVWSMGYLATEVVIWLLHGRDGVNRFRADVQGPNRSTRKPGYSYKTRHGKHTATLLPIVVRWLERLSEDPRCSPDSALGALLKMVKDRLLVVELSPERGNTKYIKDPEWVLPALQSQSRIPPGQKTPRPGLMITAATISREEPEPRPIQRYRATSEELVDRLETDIMDDEDRAGDYWLPTHEEQPVPKFSQKTQDGSNYLLPTTTRSTSSSESSTNLTSSTGRLSVYDKQFIDYVSTRSGSDIE